MDPDFTDLIAARPHLSLHALDGLVVEDVPLAAIADQVGTPTWVISAGALRQRLASLRHALAGLNARVHYAVKANDHLAVLSVLRAGGAGADVVSEGELLRALAAGMAPGDIVFSGVGKTRAELTRAAGLGIAQINIESAEELDRVAAVAADLKLEVRVALRVNPDVDAGTHAKITTGLAENKFGIAWQDAAALYRRASGLVWVRPIGLAVHIGSQILTMGPYARAFARVADLVRELRAAGCPVEAVDCGGGLGITYRDEIAASPAAFAGAVRMALGDLDVRISVEPGRWLAGPAGLLLSSVVQEKQTADRRFVVLDAAMNDLLRPALYEAWHGIVPLAAADAVAMCEKVDVVGPVCESADTFARDRLLPRFAEDARVAILDTGAYGAVMSSTYNARPLAAQVMVDGARWSVIRPRQPIEALWSAEAVPAWLGSRHG
jgi:diaminopimelate decarboxylase